MFRMFFVGLVGIMLILGPVSSASEPPVNDKPVLVDPFLVLPRTEDTYCLAKAIYFEARNQSPTGQLGVANVVLNRLHTWGTFRNICQVVYANANGGCAFTWVCDETQKIHERKIWDKTLAMAYDILFIAENGKMKDVTKGATYFHTTDVHPVWADDPGMVRTAAIDSHIFYRKS